MKWIVYPVVGVLALFFVSIIFAFIPLQLFEYMMKSGYDFWLSYIGVMCYYGALIGILAAAMYEENKNE